MSYTTTITGSDLAIALSSTDLAVDLTKTGAQGASGVDITWEGPWATATVYNVNDAVYSGSETYICVVDHTSGTFATDLTAVKWELMFTFSLTPTFTTVDVNGTVTANTYTGPNTDFRSVGSAYLTYGSTSDSLIVRTDNGAERMRIDSSGNVLVGTTSDYGKLTVVEALSGGQITVGTSTTNSTAKFGGVTGIHYTSAEERVGLINAESNSSDNIVRVGGGLGEYNAATNIRLYTATTNTTTSGTERMRINSSGNVGIGDQSPSEALSVTGNIAATGAVTAGGLTVDNATAGTTVSPEYTNIDFEGYSGSERAAVRGVDTSSSSNGGQFEILTANSSNVNTRRVNINRDGDISFYEDTGVTPKFFWDASAESLGIGTAAPASQVHLAGGVNGTLRVDTTASGYLDLSMYSNGGFIATSDAQPLRFGVSNVEAMRIAADGSVGIGTASPKGKINSVISSADNASPSDTTLASSFLQLGGGEYGSGRDFLTTYGYSTGQTNSGAYAGAVSVSSSGSAKYDLVFGTRDVTTDTAPTERMRIDSSGSVGIGTTVTPVADGAVNGLWYQKDAYLAVARNGGPSIYANRNGTDGDAIRVRKDGASVGSIGVINTDNMFISGSVANHAGLQFGTSIIYPMEAAADTDGTVTFGAPTQRFKDAYLSGGVYLGGTVAANKLDDYEEGIFTPVITFGGASVGMTFTSQSGSYTKVGDLVTVSCFITLSAKGTSTGDALVAGLPFSTSATANTYSTPSFYLNNVSFADMVIGFSDPGFTTVNMREITNAGVKSNLTNTNFSDTSQVMMNLAYRV